MSLVTDDVFFPPDNRLSPIRIVLLYSCIGIAWILLPDSVTAWFVKDANLYQGIAMMKWMLFIVSTAGFLYLLIRSYARQVLSTQKTFHRAEQEIKQLAYYDRETGLPNHNLLLDRLNQVIAFNSRKRKNTAVIYISLTGFKAVVDACGHSGGSAVVCSIAERLVSTLRQYDTVARIHRDEFVLVLGGAVLEGDVATILNKLQALFAEPIKVGTDETITPACFGVACFPADGMTSELLLQHAHIAMNQARQNNVTFQYYSEALNQKAVERHSIETGLLRALDDGEFFLCYQPKMDINGTDISGMEALVRWQRHGHGIIPPDKFIPLAEENGLIVRLGTWVLKEACRQNVAWQEAGLPKLKVAVNLSARQLRDSDFVPLVIQILAETGLDPQYLELELTESALMGNAGDTVCKLLRLKELGISISVDDFGTGYSSLSYLKHLPIDTIKVDRSFVRDIVNDPDDAAIVDAIISMAHSLKLNVIAEGVETQEQLEFLRERKCQQAQGYYFAKPLVPHQFEAFLVRDGVLENVPVSTPELQRRNSNPEVITITEDAVLPDYSGCHDASTIPSECIGDISTQVLPVHPGDNLAAVLKRFQSDAALLVLPVVDNGQVAGIINRSTFLEEHVIGSNGYAYHINHSRKMRDLMEPVKLTLEADINIRDAIQAIQLQIHDGRVDNICVTRNALYHGVVDVNRFISAMTDINLTLAKGANPLTGLPGNESIQREISKRLQTEEGFDIAYIDIDNFKPFNDYYGFQKGDVVLKTIGEIISSVARLIGKEYSCFCGHIGGDDFIIITGPFQAEYLISKIVTSLEEHLPVFHGEKDFTAGCYCAINRKGEQETFGLLSISTGIVNTLLTPVTSYAQLASISSEVKKAAKKLPGSSVVVDRRIVEDVSEN
ncbi:MAG: EAL domain-containing protein [Desulfuromonadaceae bacterium]|nr:EAL domain-containing protein [Desulfuromonadaceae bacterium]MDD5104501.1 EAL domain-containing protein [Desulfuromonadaceae bacterium]